MHGRQWFGFSLVAGIVLIAVAGSVSLVPALGWQGALALAVVFLACLIVTAAFLSDPPDLL